MNNYEYIIAGLPLLAPDGREHVDADGLMEEILSQLSPRDRALLQLLPDPSEPDSLDADFYRRALGSRNRFVRKYAALDLGLRNAKAAYLNAALGRPEGSDLVILSEDGDNPPFEGEDELKAVLDERDLLARERQLDDFVWKAVDRITVLDVFDVDLILAFVVKLRLVERWLKLDERTGRELFRKLVKEIKENRTEQNEYTH